MYRLGIEAYYVRRIARVHRILLGRLACCGVLRSMVISALQWSTFDSTSVIYPLYNPYRALCNLSGQRIAIWARISGIYVYRRDDWIQFGGDYRANLVVASESQGTTILVKPCISRSAFFVACVVCLSLAWRRDLIRLTIALAGCYWAWRMMKKRVPFIALVCIGLIEVFYGLLWGRMRIYANEAPFALEMNYTQWTNTQTAAYRKYIDVFKDQWSIVAWFGLLTIAASIAWFLIDRKKKTTEDAQPRSGPGGSSASFGTACTKVLLCTLGMMKTQPLRLRFMMLATTLTSVAMTWGIVLYGSLTHPIQAGRIFSSVDPGWSIVAFTLAGVGVALSVVSLIRRDPAGIIGVVCNLAVLSGIWRLVPVV